MRHRTLSSTLGVSVMSKDWNVGDRVYDLKLHRLNGDYFTGRVRRLGRRGGVYVEWDRDPGMVEFMYDDELNEAIV